jgi:hypothetical protein
MAAGPVAETVAMLVCKYVSDHQAPHEVQHGLAFARCPYVRFLAQHRPSVWGTRIEQLQSTS